MSNFSSDALPREAETSPLPEAASSPLQGVPLGSDSALVQAYQQQYDLPKSDAFLRWRRLAARTKAMNVVEMAGNQSFEKVLEVGCGDGSILRFLSEQGFAKAFYGCDISATAVNQAKSQEIPSLAEAIVFDGYHLPYPDGFFDLAYCSHVVEHVEYPRALIREIGRVSKQQVYEIPIDFGFYVDKKVNHFCGYGHINIFTPALFRFLLFSEGYSLIREKCGFFGSDFVRANFAGKPLAKCLFRLKSLIISSIPYLRGIKPNYYCLLVQKSGDLKTL